MRSGRTTAAILNRYQPFAPNIASNDTAGRLSTMLATWLGGSMVDEAGATAMKYALIAVLLVLAVYHG